MSSNGNRGCGYFFSRILAFWIIIWTLVAIAFAWLQSSGFARINVGGILGQFAVSQQVPFFQSLLSSVFIFGLWCVGSSAIFVLLFLLLRPRTKSSENVITPKQ
jgi:hypothetical protein